MFQEVKRLERRIHTDTLHELLVHPLTNPSYTSAAVSDDLKL